MDNMYAELNNEESDIGDGQWLDSSYLSQLMVVGDSDAVIMPPPPLEVQHHNAKASRPMKKINGLLPDKAYVCQVCSWPCTNSSNLKAHLRTHTGEKPYACNQCDQAFVQHSNLKAHLRTHTGERPYSCDVCGQTFSRSSHLTGHKRTHTGEKPYICGTCGETFATSTHLRNHVRRHTSVTPYTCSVCEVSFQHNAQLLAHMKVHNGQRPYKCCDCAGAFRSKGDLRSHRKLHADDRPFICGKCGKTFKTYQYLLKHLKKCNSAIVGEDIYENNSLNTLSNARDIKDEPMDMKHELLAEIEEFADDTQGVSQINIGDIEGQEPNIHLVDFVPHVDGQSHEFTMHAPEQDCKMPYNIKFCVSDNSTFSSSSKT